MCVSSLGYYCGPYVLRFTTGVSDGKAEGGSFSSFFASITANAVVLGARPVCWSLAQGFGAV